MKISKPLMVAAMAVFLSACGGSNDDDNAAPAPGPAPAPPPVATGDVPASALINTSSFTTFVASLMNSESTSPLNVTGVTPPTTETGVPPPL